MAFAAPPRPRRADPYASVVAPHREREDANLRRHSGAHRVDLFFGLSQDEVSRVAVCARTLRKARGEFIYLSGDRADSVYVLKQGRVKLSVMAESGKEIAIDIIEPGEVFGEFALVDESLRSNMTQALDDVTMWVFDKSDFARLLDQTKLAMNYIRLVGDRRRRISQRVLWRTIIALVALPGLTFYTTGLTSGGYDDLGTSPFDFADAVYRAHGIVPENIVLRVGDASRAGDFVVDRSSGPQRTSVRSSRRA